MIPLRGRALRLSARLIPLVVAAWWSTGSLLAQTRGSAKPATLAELESQAIKDSLDAEAHYQLGARYLELKRWDDAERQLNTTIAIEPHFARGYLSLAYLPYARNGKLLEHQQKGTLSTEERDSVARSLRLERQAFLIDPFVDLMDLRDEARLGSQLRFTREGYELHIEYAPLESLPNQRVWFHGLAAAHIHNYEEAIRTFQVLLNRETRREHSDSLIPIPLRTNDYRYILAVIYQQWGKPADALEQYQAAVAGDLGLYMAHARLAQMYKEHRMWDKAIEEAQAAVQANSDDSDLLMDLGKIQASADQVAAAEQTLRSALERNPRDPRIPYELGMVEQLNNDTAAAKLHFDRFIAIAPSRMATEVSDAQRRLVTLAP